MAKEAYYFSHDANARQDEKILMLRAEHGWEGYGIYWALIEMMFESSDSVLNHSKIKGIAVSYNIDITLLQSVINTCITEELFNSDNEHFWSESLTRRKMKFLDSKAQKSEAGSKGMAKRWGNRQPKDNDVNNGVITENNKVKESKVKEIKVKEIKESNKKEYADYVFLTETEYDKLTELFGIEERDNFFLRYASWISGQTDRVQKSRSAYLTILNWHRDSDKRTQRGFTPKPTWENKLNKFQEMYKEAEVLEREAK